MAQGQKLYLDPKRTRGPHRFWNRVDKNGPTKTHMTTPCWLWTGGTNQRYGHCHWRPLGIKNWPTVLIYAHHAAWVLDGGHIPTGLCVLHRCDTMLCVRPDHLYIGTRSDNGWDASARGIRRPNMTFEEVTKLNAYLRTHTRKQAVEHFGYTYGRIDGVRRSKSRQQEEIVKRRAAIVALLKKQPAISTRDIAKRQKIKYSLARNDCIAIGLPPGDQRRVNARQAQVAALREKQPRLTYAKIGLRLGYCQETIRQDFIALGIKLP